MVHHLQGVSCEALFEKVREGAQPQLLKARPVPYALKEKVEQELQGLEDEGIIYKVSQSDWAAPVVLVPCKDGSPRVCGDYKMAVNQCADVDQYPLPNTEDLFATLAGGQVFSKIDLSHAYQQEELDEESQKYLQLTHTRVCTVTNDCRLESPVHQLFFKGLWMSLCRGLSSQFAVWMTS